MDSALPAPPATVSGDSLGAALLAAMAAVRRTVRRRGERPAELAAFTGAQLELVRLVRSNPGVSVAEAAEDLGLAANTVSTLVRQLSDCGAMMRRSDSEDRRVVRLELSPEVSDRVAAWRDRRVVLVNTALGRLADADAEALGRALPALGRLVVELERVGAPGEVRR